MAAIAFLDDPATRYAVTAERAALAALGGGCQVPIGIHCRVAPQDEAGEWQEIFAVVADPATGKAIRIHHESRRSDIGPVALGQLAAEYSSKPAPLHCSKPPPTLPPAPPRRILHLTAENSSSLMCILKEHAGILQRSMAESSDAKTAFGSRTKMKPAS